MENATKAMIIVASAIIAVMILSVMIYLFTQAARVPAQYEYSKQAEMVADFNAKFEKYAVISDTNGNKILDSEEINFPSNSFADVITVCNLAYDINCKYENDTTNNVVVDFKINENSYCIYPKVDSNGHTVLEKGKVFADSSENVKNASGTIEMVNLYTLMETEISGAKLNDAKYDSQNRLRYKYYFDGELYYGEIEDSDELKNDGKVTNIVFKLVTNEAYDTY